MNKFLPFLDWLPKYKKQDLGGDISAGITVGVMLIPQGMAYAMLAGLPPIYGLYASTIPLIIYALMGTSRQLAVGPVAMVALLVVNGIGQIAEPGSADFISLAIVLALIVGVIQFAMGAFRLGFIVNFLSHPVIAGFTSAAAIIIGFSQLKHLLGISIPRGKVHETIIEVFRHLGDISIPTFLLGIGAIAVLIILKKVSKRIPGPLIAVVLGMAAVYFGGLHEQGVKILKDVPAGLPPFSIPDLDFGQLGTLVPIALTISFVGFMESIAVAKAVHARHKDYDLVPNQELMSLGASNIVGSFFSAFPVTGGFSRTAINDQAGAKTGLASMISAVVIILTLLFLTSYFYYLPNAILAAIIMVAVFGLIDYQEAKHLWKSDRRDFVVFMVTALATLGLGIEEGILIGVVLSLGLMIYRESYPHIAELGRVPNSREYRNIKRFENLETYEHILIVRFDTQLYFANADSLKSFIMTRVLKRKEIKHVVFEASAISSLDSSSVHMIKDLDLWLKEHGVEMYLANVKGPIRDRLKKNDIMNQENKEYFFLSTRDAVKAILSDEDVATYEEFTLQTDTN